MYTIIKDIEIFQAKKKYNDEATKHIYLVLCSFLEVSFLLLLLKHIHFLFFNMGFQALLIVLSTIAILLLIPPFIWHCKTKNIPAITLIVWLLSMDIKIFVDAIIWGTEDFANRYNGHGYCDVMVKLEVGANVGISSSVACIMYNLYCILKADKVLPGLTSFKKIVTDLSISLLSPVLVMACNYVIQVRRYTIFQYSGCQTALSFTWLTIILYTLWMVIWSLVGVIFAILIIVKFFQKRKDVRDILKCTNSGLNLARFAKLLIFCIIVILVMFPFSLYVFTDDLGNVSPHFNFSEYHSSVFWDAVIYLPFKAPYYVTWVYLSVSYAVFIFFGLGSDAIEMYLEILSKIGFGPLIRFAKAKKQQRQLAKADKLVSNVTMNREVNGTPFDVEMQKIIDDEYDDKSPTSTTISNVFADKHEINNHGNNRYNNFQYLSGMNESMLEGLDEDDLNYINMLYQHDVDEGRVEPTSQDRIILDDLQKEKAKVELSTPISPKESIASTSKDSEFDFVYKLQHKNQG